MLAAVHPTDALPGDITNLNSWIKRTSTTALTFSASTNFCGQASVELLPLMNVVNEGYAVYFHTKSTGSIAHYSASGTVISGDRYDFSLGGGASIVSNGNAENIRSGDPGQSTSITWSTLVQDNTHTITGVSFSYRYVAGYGGANVHTGTIMTLVVADECNNSPQTLYKSPELIAYPFDGCNTCYSPAQNVNVQNLNIAATTARAFTLDFQDNNRNVQLLLPMNITIHWR